MPLAPTFRMVCIGLGMAFMFIRVELNVNTRLVFSRRVVFGLVLAFKVFALVFMEQRLARSRCFWVVFVFEHFFYSSATRIL